MAGAGGVARLRCVCKGSFRVSGFLGFRVLGFGVSKFRV